jgi:sugar phosphate isomerase/epimerase
MTVPPPALILESPPLAFAPALREAAALGFTRVAVSARAERLAEDLEALADSGLVVAAAALGEDLPTGCTLDNFDVGKRRRALEVLQRQVSDAGRLGATCVWLSPGADASAAGRACFAEACALVADYAAQRMVRLCVTHAPGSALPSAGQALAWVEQAPETVGLMLDTSRLAPDEEVEVILKRAGPRLGAVCFPVGQVFNLPEGRQVANLPHELVVLCRREDPRVPPSRGASFQLA